MRALLLAMQLVVSQGGVAPAALPDDSIHIRADSAIRRFLVEWRDAWQLTQYELPVTPHIFDHDLR